MAIETIDGDFDILNVSGNVGLWKTNERSDVLIVQALLKYVREGIGGRTVVDFLPNEPPLPAPDGVFIPGETDRHILAYQKFTNKSVSRILLAEDGVVSPAKESSAWEIGRKWTIAELNERACIIALTRRHGTDHIEVIREIFPQVRKALAAFALPF